MLFKNLKRGFKKPNKEAERQLRNEIEAAGGLEKKDLPAMIIAAFLVIFLPILLLVGVALLLFWLIF